MIKIGIKYCGGCNPVYDRISLVDEIRSKLNGRAEISHKHNSEARIILAVMGCPTACAELEPFENRKVIIVDGSKNAKDVVEEINNFLKY